MLMFFHAKETVSEKHTFWIRPEICHFYQIYLYKYLIFLLLCSIFIKSFDSMLKCQKVYFMAQKRTRICRRPKQSKVSPRRRRHKQTWEKMN